MNVACIHPFLAAAIEVFQTMAFTEPHGNKPFLKARTPLSQGDITGIDGLIGDRPGALGVRFSDNAMLHIGSNMCGAAYKALHDDIREAVGAFTHAPRRPLLQAQGKE